MAYLSLKTVLLTVKNDLISSREDLAPPSVIINGIAGVIGVKEPSKSPCLAPTGASFPATSGT